jgi:transcriptional regulator with GAF, ATPase, and Fis domain
VPDPAQDVWTPAQEVASRYNGGSMSGGLADLLACVAAFARSLDGVFDPQRFLDEFSERAQALVPHDGTVLAWLEDEGRSFSVFARHITRRGIPLEIGNYTIAFDPGGRFSRDVAGFASVFDGESQRIDDASAAADRAPLRAWANATGFRSRIGVPLYAGGRVVGAFLMGAVEAGRFTDAHVVACRQLADLIGPFVDNVVLLHRERRRRERLQAVTALAPVLGASLNVGDVIERLGAALRPTLDFDLLAMGLLGPTGQDVERFGLLVDGEPSPPRTIAVDDSSVLPRVLRQGEVVVVRDVETEFGGGPLIDREFIAAGHKSALFVPLMFGDRIGGGLCFAKRRPNWYDAGDVEIAEALASAVVLAMQHQRLADEQRRVAVAEASARQLAQRVQSLRGALEERFGFDTILGRSPAFRVALEQARKVAPTDTSVLLTGDSGTGKEVLARAIHQGSLRAEASFVAVNCAALPETLIESELFGHERGAFTGADRLKRGRFELAGGGTLFLDEVGELALPMQAKLLRVLQERRYERVGGTATLSADVRLIAATNRDLEAAVAAGRFRDDLYYRLAVFRVHLPSLRERGDDILRLADRFLRDFGERMGKRDVGLSREARDLLLTHRWPGNIRELQNAIERAVILSDGGLISAAQLGVVAATAAAAAGAPSRVVEQPGSASQRSIPEMEREAITEALRRANGNKSHAAIALGLSRTRFYTLLRRYGIK